MQPSTCRYRMVLGGLLFSSDLTTPQLNAFKMGAGLSVANSETVQKKWKKKKEEDKSALDRRTSKGR